MSKELMQLNDSQSKTLNELLGDLEAKGVVVAELRPSLGAVLSDKASGGFPGRVFLGENKGFQTNVPMKSMGDADETHDVDVLELKDVTGDFNGEVFSFNASNGGLKAKVGRVKGSKYVMVVFRGENEADNKLHNPWKDYGILGADDLALLKPAYTKVKATYKPGVAA